MSVTYCVYVVAGFEVEIKPVMKTRVKYDEDTGNPYNDQEESHRVACDIETGIELISSRDDPDAFCDGETVDDEYKLQLHSNGDATSHPTWIIGQQIAELGEYGNGMHCVVDTHVPDNVRDYAEKYGLTPKLHVLFYISV